MASLNAAVTPLRVGVLLSSAEARQIAEALVTIQQVAGRVGVHLIDKLDVLDGDADLEANGDELDGTHAEDEEGNHLGRYGMGPGCSIADPDSGIEDRPHDWDEMEACEGHCGHTRHYGVDQSRPIGPGNREVL